MALMGPGLMPEARGENETAAGESDNGVKLPGYVVVPEGYGYIAVMGQRAKNATYEPFGPSSYYQQADIDIAAPESGRYYAVVYDNYKDSNDKDRSNGDNGGGGHYSLALGYIEEFSFTDRLVTPLSLVSVYLWEGQSLIAVITPWMVAALVGAFVILRSPRRTPFFAAGTLAGFLYLGTSASVLTQTVFNLTRAPYGPEVGISLALALIPTILGIALIRLAGWEAGILQRSVMAVIGTIGLLAGSGFIIGPLLAIAASVLPNRNRQKEAESR
jgi:hypothetical protein